MKMKCTKIGDITLEEKVLEDEMSTDDIERVLSLKEEFKTELRDPKAESRALRKKIEDIDKTIDRLLESLTPINKEYVDRKLIGLKREHDQLEQELEALEALPSQIVDIGAVADEIIESMGPFKYIFKEGTLEEQKEFIRLFVQRIGINAEEKRAWVHIRRFPAPESLVAGNPSFNLVAGAGFEPATFGL